MILTKLEVEIMKLGNPPSLDEYTPRDPDDYTQEQKDRLVRLYKTRHWSYRRLATDQGWHESAAYEYLASQGLLTKRKPIPAEDYDKLRPYVQANLRSEEIAKLLGWDKRRVMRMRENLRKRRYIGRG